MTKNATGGAKTRRKTAVRTVQAGSVTVKIYEGRNRGKPCFTVIWYIGEKRQRKGFFDLREAKKFARDQAEKLAAGQVTSPTVTIAQAQEFKEAKRRLASLEMPIHVVAGEYVDAVNRLGTCLRSITLEPTTAPNSATMAWAGGSRSWKKPAVP
jgi:hypothetical protein